MNPIYSGNRLPGLSGERNEQTGEVTITVTHWVATFPECLTFGDPTFSGFALDERRFDNYDAENDEAGYRLELVYRGAGDITDNEGGEPAEQWTFDTSFKEEPIETHPRFKILKTLYGGTVGEDGKVTWPENLPENLASELNVGLSKQEKARDRKNPLFGLRSYLVFGAIARRTYVSDVIGTGFAGIGSVFEELPGQAPEIQFDDGRNWLKMAPKPQSAGDQWRIVEEYILSPEGGWPPTVHEFIRT